LADVDVGPNLAGQLIALVLNTATKEVNLLFCSDVDPRLITSYISRLKNASYAITQKYQVSPSIITQIMAQEEAQATEANEGEVTEAIRYLTRLISQAHELNSSDIHVTKRKYGAIVEMRVNGEMLKVDEVTCEQAENMIRATYNSLANAKQVSFNEAEIQDAKININTNGKTFNIRYAHAPIFPDGYHVSMRLLENKQDSEIVTLKQLGYTPGQIRAINLIMSKPDGAVIIAGTTGSGKSTTLNSLLSTKALKDKFKSNILTVEDPPEYEIKGSKQTPVVRSRRDAEAGRNRFAETIVSAMRRDPDVIMIGEIRDVTTAMAFIDAVLTGHLGFSTIHASDAFKIVSRLVTMGSLLPTNPVSKDILCEPGFISGLMYQKLVPVLCEHCKIPFAEYKNTISEGLCSRIMRHAGDHMDSIYFRNDTGCDACNAGIAGRTVCAQVVVPDYKLLDCLQQGKTFEAFRHWREQGNQEASTVEHRVMGVTAVDVAVAKMQKGMVSPVTVEEKFGLLGMQAIMEDGIIGGQEINSL